MIYYKSYRIIDGKPRWVIIDDNGNIINKNPAKGELKGLEKEIRKPYDTLRGKRRKYTDEELFGYLRRFYDENGRIPVKRDFDIGDPRYPSSNSYVTHFGSWSSVLKLIKLDVESMVEQGVLETCQQKARLTEMMVRDHFEKNPIDLARENQNNPCDGICPNGKFYDVKSSKFDGMKWHFNAGNKHKDEIEIYYFLAFNEDWTKLEYVWRVPGEIVEKDYFYVGLKNSGWEFTIDDMEKYDITCKFKDR